MSVITPERRLTAHQLVELLTGVRLLALATTTADGRPIVGPVDGILHRGSFWFGSAPDSLRIRHIRARPHVSASHIDGEQLAVTVHGVAHVHDLRTPELRPFRERLDATYRDRYGADWIDWAETMPYCRIEASRMLTFWMPAQA